MKLSSPPAHCSIKASFLLLLLSNVYPQIQSAKILLWPFPYYSHIKEFTHIGQGLHDKGHHLHLILPPSLPQIQEFRDNRMVKIIEYVVKDRDFHQMTAKSEEAMDDLLEAMTSMTPVEDFRTNTDGFTQICTNPLEDEQLYHTLKANAYDLAFIDGFPVTRCYYILMYRLGIPYISLATQYEPWLFRTPALPSFVPCMYSHPLLTPEMTFWERLSNAYTLVDWAAFPNIPYLEDSLVAKYAPDMPFVTLDWLAGRSLLWLFDTDIVIDFPRPTMPNEINIGGLSTRPGKPLEKELLQFVDSAEHGVVLVSFGSLSSMPKKHLQVFIDAFTRIKQHVIFRYVHNPKPQVADHIKLLDWIPQNDILAHPNMRLFITHCGANSQFESLYHGVPMLNIPLFGDQPYNAKRADYKGYSRTLSLMGLNSHTLLETIEEILTNDTYSNAVRKGAAIFKSAPMMPRERAVYWIENVLKFGGDHLHSYALDMPWYEYLMLDILAVLVLILIVGLVLIIAMLTLCVKTVCKSSNKPDVKIKKH